MVRSQAIPVVRKEAAQPFAVIWSLLVGNPTVLVDERGAEEAHDRFMETGCYPVPVPIGGGRFVLHFFEHLFDDALTAFLDWQMDRWTRQMVISDMDIQASGVPSAQA